MKNLESMEQFQQVTKEEDAVLMFSAGWCPDCRVIEPVLPEIESAFPQFTFYYVDRDEFIDLCRELDVFGIPSFLVYKNGQEVDRFVSKDRKTKEEIEQFLSNAATK
ncbi:thioredoxin family protein [Halalkalibacterium ligniniphilum]|uniref:thioredoxin family protein n=1 Tax=Halalkalibacterium ligniniphilum TaxID=1134413 RepID=UPI000365678C|nr:thioredoxin family protein [Halalkalibacterium ligniniphilum]